MHHQQPPRLAHGLADGRHVQWHDSAWIDDLHGDGPLQAFRRRQCLAPRVAQRHNGDIRPLPHDFGLTDRHEPLALGHILLLVEQQTVLDDQHGAIVADGRPQKSLGVVGGAGHHDLEAGSVGEPGLEALGVLRAFDRPRTRLGANRHRHAELSPRHEANLGHLVDDRIHGHEDKVDVHDLDHRAQSRHGGSHGQSAEGLLADRRAHHPLWAERLKKSARQLEDSPLDIHILANHEHGLVPLHFLPLGLADGIGVGQAPRRASHGGRTCGLRSVRWLDTHVVPTPCDQLKWWRRTAASEGDGTFEIRFHRRVHVLDLLLGQCSLL